MQLEYRLLVPDLDPPMIDARQFLAILIADKPVSTEWRNRIANWLIASDCHCFVAWGIDCEAWHDNVDWAVRDANEFGDIPDNRFVMTTWHDNESLSKALWFAGNCAFHPDVELQEAVILHIAHQDERDRILKEYQTAQEIEE